MPLGVTMTINVPCATKRRMLPSLGVPEEPVRALRIARVNGSARSRPAVKPGPRWKPSLAPRALLVWRLSLVPEPSSDRILLRPRNSSSNHNNSRPSDRASHPLQYRAAALLDTWVGPARSTKVDAPCPSRAHTMIAPRLDRLGLRPFRQGPRRLVRRLRDANTFGRNPRLPPNAACRPYSTNWRDIRNRL